MIPLVYGGAIGMPPEEYNALPSQKLKCHPPARQLPDAQAPSNLDRFTITPAGGYVRDVGGAVRRLLLRAIPMRANTARSTIPPPAYIHFGSPAGTMLLR
jgi:hypothetical protein